MKTRITILDNIKTAQENIDKAIDMVEAILSERDKVWSSADRPSFLWDFVDYRIEPSELKHEAKFAKTILRARKWKHG